MSDKVDMSLDDIIKINRKSRGGKQNNRGKGKANRNTAAVMGRKGKGQVFKGQMRGTIKGGVVKRRRSDGGAPVYKTKAFRHALQQNKIGKFQLKKVLPGRKRSMSEGGGGSSKLLISNLDFGVSNHDIKELFGEFGPLKKAAVHFDQSGKSLGSAEVIFEKKVDAIKAHKQYNNIPLDGRAMNIQLVGDFAAMKVTATSRLGQKRILRGGGFAGNKASRGANNGYGGNKNQARGGFNKGRGRGGNRGGRGGKQNQGKTPTKEDLDAQMDAYNSKSMETS